MSDDVVSIHRIGGKTIRVCKEETLEQVLIREGLHAVPPAPTPQAEVSQPTDPTIPPAPPAAG